MGRMICWLLLVSVGCSHAPAPPTSAASTSGSGSNGAPESASFIDDPRLARVVTDHWAWTLESFPEFATRLGDHRFDDRLTDVRAAAIAERRDQLRAFQTRLNAIDETELSAPDRTNHELLSLEIRSTLEAEPCRFEFWSLSPRGNPVTELNYLPQSNLPKTAAGADALLARYRAGAEQVEHQIQNLRAGANQGWYANAESTRRVLTMVDEQLSQPTEQWPMYTEAEPWFEVAASSAYAKELLRLLESEVRPALTRYRALLADTILPRARSDEDGVGLSGLPFSEACYAARIRSFTTLDLDAETVHQTGLSEIRRINREMTELGARLFGHETLASTLAELRKTDDPRLYFDSGEEIVAKAESALARARAAIPQYFGRLPQARCVVREIPAYEAPFTTVAYYRQPVPGGGRPGEYYVNTYAPTTRTRYEAEALAFHESIPGHHLQIAISQELEGLPPFRKHLGMTVFVEGWALYAESLAEEMGLYSGDLDRLGQLSYEAWRAARLVVDTGLHAKGWTRSQAQAFMLQHTALAPNNIDNEVDRYIVWPGQALAYKTGQLEISRLRAEAEAQLGERFDLAAFHDVVLRGGAVSLPVLRRQVKAWVATQSSQARLYTR